MKSIRYLLMSKVSFLIVITVLVTLAASQLISSNNKNAFNPYNLYNGASEGNNEDLAMEFSTNCTYNPQDFKQIANAIERALIFFEGNVGKLVLDAAVGTRILEAQLNHILLSHPKLPAEITVYLTYLLRKSQSLSDRIILSVSLSRKISPIEKEHTLPWVTTQGLWEWPINGRWESPSIMESYEPPEGMNISGILNQSKDIMEEAQSDTCIYQTFNCETNAVSDVCKQLFLDKEQALYSLTHQVIYTLFATKRQCFRQQTGDVHSVDNLRNFQERLCGKVWLEANAIDRTGFPANYRDLFVEQVGICGMTGYPNFLRQDWLYQILSWQSKRKSGCFLDPRVEVNNVAMLVKLYRQNQQKFHDMIQMNRFKLTSRQKRSDAFLRQANNENCSVHFTAVGISALAMHLRYFFQNCLANY